MLKVEVRGTGCPKCKKLYDETKSAIARSGVAADLAKINQIDEITKRGVMVTPALVIDGEVRASGRVPPRVEIVEWLMTAAGGNTDRGSSTSSAASESSSNPRMPAKAIVRAALLLFVISSIGFLIYRASGHTTPSPDRATATATSAAPSDKLVAYYFHRTKRCVTCRTIESRSKTALEAAFSDDLAAGRLEWHAVNLDEAANEHFINDYGVSWSSLVLANEKDGRTVRFKVLDKTWDFARDQAALANYVQAEARSWLKVQ